MHVRVPICECMLIRFRLTLGVSALQILFSITLCVASVTFSHKQPVTGTANQKTRRRAPAHRLQLFLVLLAQSLVDGEVAVFVGVGVLLDFLPHNGGGSYRGEVIGGNLHAAATSPGCLHKHTQRWWALATLVRLRQSGHRVRHQLSKGYNYLYAKLQSLLTITLSTNVVTFPS